LPSASFSTGPFGTLKRMTRPTPWSLTVPVPSPLSVSVAWSVLAPASSSDFPVAVAVTTPLKSSLSTTEVTLESSIVWKLPVPTSVPGPPQKSVAYGPSVTVPRSLTAGGPARLTAATTSAAAVMPRAAATRPLSLCMSPSLGSDFRERRRRRYPSAIEPLPDPLASPRVLEFRILGPLEVVTERGVARLGGIKPRATLAILLLDANRVVSVERLADDLYAGSAPVTAVTQVQRQVSELRKA